MAKIPERKQSPAQVRGPNRVADSPHLKPPKIHLDPRIDNGSGASGRQSTAKSAPSHPPKLGLTTSEVYDLRVDLTNSKSNSRKANVGPETEGVKPVSGAESHR
jgi:hypothetical protein